MCWFICSAVAVRDVSSQCLKADLTECTVSPGTLSTSGESLCRRCCRVAGGGDDSMTDADTDKIAVKMSLLAASDDPAAATCVSSPSSLPASSCDKGCECVEATDAVLCLLQALSHCSYHESSLLLLADHVVYDVAAELFTRLWHQLQTSQQPNDKTQASICVHIFAILVIADKVGG